ncbi:MAG: tRNA (N(6)-L-threonylcarbamoyladenosine(37)-C(2))-methylthiotransferase [Candidatus Diapherotrites archaeon]
MAIASFHVEGYGCSMNRADTEAIRGFLCANGLTQAPLSGADCIIINTCAVKEQTENRMLNRIRKLWLRCKMQNSQLIVFGCLPKVSAEKISEISNEIVQIGPELSGLAEFLNLPAHEFGPAIDEVRGNPHIAIIPISRGCTGACTYCATVNARGKLKSYGMREINKKFRRALSQGVKEFWLTAQDCGCYGFDRKPRTDLPALLELLLKNKGDYRVRVGMMNPQHLHSFYSRYITLLRDERMYKFMHIPLQSGSERILKLMNRPYSAHSFLALARRLRKDLPSATISTDVIIGFPTETENDFRSTVSLLKEFSPDIVNISRFGARPNTMAADMKQIHGRVKKARSRILSELCAEIAVSRNKRMVGKSVRILIAEYGAKGGYLGRTENYKPVPLKKDMRGQFADAIITSTGRAHLNARLV